MQHPVVRPENDYRRRDYAAKIRGCKVENEKQAE